jgi:GNAT superfamily N-acetyltransferase
VSRGGDYAIAPLDRTLHDRAAFSCGNELLDRYLRLQAGQDMARGVAAVFVATQRNDTRVRGYFTLSQSAILLGELPNAIKKRLPRYPDVPVTLLGRLAVDSSAQGTGLGALMLGDGCRRAAAVASEVPSVGVLVDAIDENAARFYQHFGFVALSPESARLFLPMVTIERAV